MLTEIALAQQACLQVGRLRDKGLYVSVMCVALSSIACHC